VLSRAIMKNDAVFDLSRHPVHLGLGATIHPQPEHTGTMEWYMAYGARHGSDGAEGRLVAIHTFSRPWDTWEVHPEGEELVVCLAGELVLHQEIGDEVRTVTLRPHEAVVNPRGVWHTADATGPTTAMFITAGIGTETRPRS
jgi:mannose-6-phosphate isomerase-like protein (cupin superfamily)